MNNHVAKNEFNQNYQSIVRHWKQIAVNQHLENQTVSNKLPVVPGKSSYKDATDRTNSTTEIFQFSVTSYQRGSDGRHSIVTLNLVRQNFLVFQEQA